MKKLENAKAVVKNWWENKSAPKKVLIVATTVVAVAGAIFVVCDKVRQNGIINDIDSIADVDAQLASLDVVTSL